MKGDTCIHPVTKWRAQSPGAKISRKLMAIKMNNFFDERPQDSDPGMRPMKEGKKRRSRRARPLTATLARPRLLDITLLGKIDMSLMRKELLSVYRLMRVPMEAHRANIARMRDKKNALKEISSGNKREQKAKNNIAVEVTQPASESIIKKDVIIKDKSSFKLFPGVGLAAKNRSKVVDEVFSGQVNKPLPKPCDSCGRASRPERLHAHPQRTTASPTRIKLSPASARRSTNETSGVGTLDKLNHLSINRASSSCERRRSPSRKAIHDENPDKSKEEKKLADAPPVCPYCGRRFGTSSLPIHEAKCRLKYGKKIIANKINHEASHCDTSREAAVQIVSPRKLSANELALPKHRSSRNSSPRRKSDLEKEKEDDSYVFHPSLHPPVRRSPINSSVHNKTDDDVSQSEISDVEYSTKEYVDLEDEVEWKTHLKSLIKCSNCDRAFAPDRIHRHQAVCDGSSKRSMLINTVVNTRKIRVDV